MSAIILAFTDSMAAARRLGASLDLPVHQVAVHRFPDNEALVRIPASAQSVISPPGRMPSTSTSAPLIVSTTRTSAGAATVVAVIGASKYITFTTRM